MVFLIDDVFTFDLFKSQIRPVEVELSLLSLVSQRCRPCRFVPVVLSGRILLPCYTFTKVIHIDKISIYFIKFNGQTTSPCIEIPKVYVPNLN